MANVITAGNSTNGGTAITTDTSGTLNIVTGSGSGATAVTVDGSGNMVVTGTLTASGGVSGGIRSGTAVASTSGTSIDFTSLPTGIKRITVMFDAVSTSGTSNWLIQLGDSGGVENTGYLSVGTFLGAATGGTSYTAGFGLPIGNATHVAQGLIILSNLNGNGWTANGSLAGSGTAAGFIYSTSGAKTLSATIDRVRITTAGGTDTFDTGTINILFE
jgi:hypothetical protein